MSSAWFDATASTRPRIKRDVLFTETPDGVLFHNADGGFRLAAKSAYRFATLLVPHLNGERTVAEICHGMSIRQRERVGELVGTLYERGFARSVSNSSPANNASASISSKDVLRRYEAQIGYIEHYTDDAERRFGRFRKAQVAVVGDDEMARWCALSLIRNGSGTVGVMPKLRDEVEEEARRAQTDGCPVDVRDLLPAPESSLLTWEELDGYDVVVVTGGPEAPQALFPLLRSEVPPGCTLIPAWSIGQSTVVGPLMSKGSTGCWACAVLRWGANGGAAEAADIWSSLALGKSDLKANLTRSTTDHGTYPGRPMAAMLGNLLGFEVFRTVTGVLPTETAGKVIIQDTESLDVTSEVLLPHPSCPICLDDTEQSVPDLDLSGADVDGADQRGLPTAATAREADALVQELNRYGLLLQSRAGVFTRFDDEALIQTPLKLSIVELGLGHGRQRRVGAVDVHHVAGARMRALYRAAETYAEHMVPAATVAAGQGLNRVAPRNLGTYGGSGSETEVRGWAVAASLLTQRRLLVPVESIRPFSAVNRDRLFEATRAGMGVGASASAAAAQGLLSAIAYEALTRAVRGSEAGPLLLDTLDDPEMTFLARSAANLSVDFELIDLQEQARSGIAVVLARSGARWAVAADFSRQAAAVAALRDLLGEVQFEEQSPDAGVSLGDPLLRDLDPRAISAGTVASAGEVPAVTWNDVLRSLGEQGRDVLVVPTASADLAHVGLNVARVLLTAEAPGAR